MLSLRDKSLVVVLVGLVLIGIGHRFYVRHTEQLAGAQLRHDATTAAGRLSDALSIGGPIDLGLLTARLTETLPAEHGYRLLDAHGEPILGSAGPPAAHVSAPVEFFDTTWILQAWWIDPPRPSPWGLALIWGGIGTLMAMTLALLRGMAISETQLRAEVAERTRELLGRNAELDRALAEMASLSRFQEKLLNTDALLIAVCDSEGGVHFWNAGAESITGYTRQEVMSGLNVWDALYGRSDFERILRTGTALFEQDHRLDGFETTFRDRRGTERTLSWLVSLMETDGDPRVMVIGIDITAQKRALALLYESEERFRMIFDQASIGLLLTNPDGTFERVNECIAGLLGYSRRELGALRVHDIAHPDEMNENLAAIRAIAAGELPVYRAEKRCVQRDGAEVWVDLTASPLRRENGEVKQMLAACVDITGNKLQELELRRTRTELEETIQELKDIQGRIVQQERMRAVATMASGIAHDFNNNLAVICGLTELLEAGLAGAGEELRAKVRRIHTAASDAAHTVKRMREIYRPRSDAGPRTPVALPQLVREAVEITRPHWRDQALARGRDIEVATELRDVPDIQGDPAEIREALTNLIMNAVHAMPNGGTLSFRTDREDSRVVLRVSDTGTGMSSEVLRRCMDPFYTTKGEDGSGLGLAMVQGIMERHSGVIRIDSHPGRGTTFHLSFRVATGEEQGRPAQARDTAAQQELRILVVDDEEAVREVMMEMVQTVGHRPAAAASGAAALEAAAREPFDVVITDRAMPGMNGDELAAELRARSFAAPIIMLTGFGSMMHDDDERVPGIDLVLSKPVVMRELLEAIAQVTAPAPAAR